METSKSISFSRNNTAKWVTFKTGYFSAMFTAVLGVITLGFALTAIPISGANCPVDCVQYPYLDTTGQFPKDFVWMPLAIFFILGYLVLSSVIAHTASPEKKLFTQIGRSLAVLATGILVVDYYLQFFVIPMSLFSGETEGLPLLIQYNPHGIFLILEEIGYLLMSVSFLFLSTDFLGKRGLEGAVRWIFQGGFGLAFLGLFLILFLFGLNRQDRFEVIVISINWLVLIMNGVLLSLVYRKKLRPFESDS